MAFSPLRVSIAYMHMHNNIAYVGYSYSLAAEGYGGAPAIRRAGFTNDLSRADIINDNVCQLVPYTISFDHNYETTCRYWKFHQFYNNMGFTVLNVKLRKYM